MPLPLAKLWFLTQTQIDEGFVEDDLETNLQRDKYARLCNTVNQLVDELTPSAPDFQLRDACDQLVRILGHLLILFNIHRDLVDGHDRDAGDAGATRLIAWTVGYPRGSRGQVFQGGYDEAFTDHKSCECESSWN